ncbi:TetR/AcrR family transcriptional regulator, partial [Streptosporangium canum]|uniref:TetR/AcrR family transcriptional regulator n=1 Tax=Streptosporangium canum TaxID=324952 RepID=UPI0037914C02
MTTDQRLARGARARRTITRHAVDVASVEGLSGLSFGRLATDLGLSKGGVATLFPTKEHLQLATAETAREVFIDAVVRPTSDVPPGIARLRALVERWISYAQLPLFAGGCFWAANLPDFDSRPGPVRDVLRRQHQAWLAVLAEQVSHAVGAGGIPRAPPPLTPVALDPEGTAAHQPLGRHPPGGAAP